MRGGGAAVVGKRVNSRRDPDLVAGRIAVEGTTSRFLNQVVTLAGKGTGAIGMVRTGAVVDVACDECIMEVNSPQRDANPPSIPKIAAVRIGDVEHNGNVK